MSFLNIASYKFIHLSELEVLQNCFLNQCQQLSIKGTILLSNEGININLAGAVDNIINFKNYLANDSRFADIFFRESYSSIPSFKRLKVKIKKEIITLRDTTINPTEKRAPAIAPENLKQWLDEKHDVLLLDTRNTYEVRFGTFSGAKHLHLKNFCELPAAIKNIPHEQPIVMFCTGGIRCEKAALLMLEQGFSNVYQLDGGILNYFAKIGGAHFNGECFVFDERVSVDSQLKTIGTRQCPICQGPTTECSGCRVD